MNTNKYFASTERVAQMVCSMLEYGHASPSIMEDYYSRCKGILNARIPQSEINGVHECISLFCKACQKVVDTAFKAEENGFDQCVFDARAEIKAADAYAEEAGLGWCSTTYWMCEEGQNSIRESEYPDCHDITLGRAVNFLAFAYRRLKDMFDICLYDDPKGFKLIGKCPTCGCYFFKKRKSMIYCSDSCGQNARYHRRKENK